MSLLQAQKSVWQNSVRFVRNNRKWWPRSEPETFERVIFPPNGEYKLPAMPQEPTYDPKLGEEKFKSSRQLVSIRGVEEIHTELIHKQYGLAAIGGGFISPYDFNFIRDRLNRNLLKNQFAIWRVPAPWLPRTKRAVGAKAGSGKGNIHHYVTPVRARRIILEVGGYIMELEARAYLMYLCERFRFPVEFVSEKILVERRLQEKKVEEMNINQFNWELALKYNMQNCHGWLSYYDVAYKYVSFLKNNESLMTLVGEEELLWIPFRWFVLMTASLPFFALSLCVSLSLVLHLDESTRTHCGVVNYLPSISAAVASFTPERYIWQFFISLHSAPRIVAALAFKQRLFYIYRNLLLTSPLRPLNDRVWFELSCQAACFVNIAESLFLLLLTSASSTDSYAIHKISFLGFAICSIIYMLLATSLLHYSGRRRTSSLGEKSFQYKVLMCSASILSLLFAVYFFNRHNTYCEPGVYTLITHLIFMVFFSCNTCSEALKKNQVEKHGFRCRYATYSCLDCGQNFSLETFKGHMKCVTESKKYGGKNYVEKENKGEIKQNRWIEQVERAIGNVKEQRLKCLLEQIRGFDNIPRKETKFVNFLQNSINIRDRDLCIKAWNCISEQARKIEEETKKAKSTKICTPTAEEEGVGHGEGFSRNVTEKKEKKRNDLSSSCDKSANTNSPQRTLETKEVKFKWKRAIKRTLKEAENGQMKVKRLKAKVIEYYLANKKFSEIDENPELIFNAKLQSLNLQYDGKMTTKMSGNYRQWKVADEHAKQDLEFPKTGFKVERLFALCMRKVATFRYICFRTLPLPSHLIKKLRILRNQIGSVMSMHNNFVSLDVSWIYVGKDGFLHWPRTCGRCYCKMSRRRYFIFAAINGIATLEFVQVDL
ncbi:unnamed protein product, partial [Thelazia callipaeda]|uniref:Ribosomal protein L16 n=1 Tax=Thelazia callipaeda TaxID=103827 RepID=A0A0N5D760_THECL